MSEHDKLREYVESRGCVFERMTQKGRWRYILMGKHPIEIPPPIESYNKRQWGNIKDLVRRDIDKVLARAGERPAPGHALPPTVFTPAPPPEERIPITVDLDLTEPAPPALPTDEELDVAVRDLNGASPSTEDSAMAKNTVKRKLHGQPCPVKGCGKPALGKHISMHIRNGELPKGFKLPRSRSPEAKVLERERAERRPRTVDGTGGPLARKMKELATEFAAEWKDISEASTRAARLVEEMVKLSSDQETTLRLVTEERDEYKGMFQGFEAMVAKRRTASTSTR